MADLKTEQGITAEIKKQQAEYDKLDGRLKSARKIKADIVKLEEKLVQVQNKVSSAEKSINAEIDKRIKKVRELASQDSASARLKSAAFQAQNQTLQLIKKEVSAGAQLKGTLKEQEQVVLSLGSGMNDIAGVQNLQAQSADRLKGLQDKEAQARALEQKQLLSGNVKLAMKANLRAEELSKQQGIEESLANNLKIELESLRINEVKKQQLSVLDKLTFGLASKAIDFKDAFQENPKLAGYIALGGIIGLIAKAATTFSANIDKIGEQFGSLNNLGQDFQDQLVGASVDVTNLGFGIADVNSVVSSLSSEFGVSLDVAADLSTQILDTAKATGLSVDEATKLTGELRIIAGLSQEQSEALIEGTAQLARQAGVAPQQVLKDIAGSSETIAIFTKGTGENLFEAAVAARQLGLSVDSIAKSARSTLDFESSIQAELEASTLLGQQINLQRARQLALNKDLVGFQNEIKNQLSSIGDFSELNVFQQESLAKAVGMSVNEVAKLVSGTDKLSVAGALAAGTFDDLSGQDALSQLSKITGQFKELAATFLNSLGPTISNVLVNINEFLGKEENIEAIKEKFQSLANVVGLLVKSIPVVGGVLAGIAALKFSGAVAGLELMAVASKKGIGSAIMKLITTAFSGPAGIIGGIAAVGAATLAYNSLKKLTSVDDFHSGPGGITHMVGPAGAFQLNPKDSVLATTNQIPVRRANDLMMTGEGGITTNNNMDLNPLIEAANRTTQAVASLTLGVDHNRIKMESDRGQIAVT